MPRRESEDHDGAAARIRAASKGSEGLALTEPQVVEGALGGRQRASISLGVRHQEDHVILAAVALLERDAPLERLEIIEHRLRLDRDPPAPPADERVPRAEVALDRKRYLGRPTEARMEAHPKPLEEADLPRVANGITGRVGPEPHIQADDGSDGSKVGMTKTAGAPMLELPELDVVDVGRLSNDAQTQPRADAMTAKVGGERPKIVGCPSSASIRRAFASGHPRIMARVPYLPIRQNRSVVRTTTSDNRGPHSVDRTLRRSCGVVHQPTPGEEGPLKPPQLARRPSLVVRETTWRPDADADAGTA
jgi:hypothetical protein